MYYNELLNKLIFLTKRNNITQLEIGRAIEAEKGAINARAKRNSKFKPQEIEAIEEAFNIKFNSIIITDNSFEQQNDTIIPSKAENFGRRLTELQDKHELLDKDMAKLLRISEDKYMDIKMCDTAPNLEILIRLKQRFKVSIDWLLFGE